MIVKEKLKIYSTADLTIGLLISLVERLTFQINMLLNIKNLKDINLLVKI